MASTLPLPYDLPPHHMRAMLHPPHHRLHRRHRRTPPPPHYMRLARPPPSPDNFSPPLSPDSLSGTSSFSRLGTPAFARRDVDELDDLRLPESSFRRRIYDERRVSRAAAQAPGIVFPDTRTFTLRRTNVSNPGAAWLQVFDDSTGGAVISAHGRVGLEVDLYDGSGNLLLALEGGREVVAKNRFGEVVMSAVPVGRGRDEGVVEERERVFQEFEDEDPWDGLDQRFVSPRFAEGMRESMRMRTPMQQERMRRRSLSRERGRARARARSMSRDRFMRGPMGGPMGGPMRGRMRSLSREREGIGMRSFRAEREFGRMRSVSRERDFGRSDSRGRDTPREESAEGGVHHWPQANGYDYAQGYAQSAGREDEWRQSQRMNMDNVGNYTHARRQFTSTGQIDPDYFQRVHYYNSPLLDEPYSDLLTAPAGRRLAEGMRGGTENGLGGSRSVVVAEFWGRRVVWFKLVRAVEGGKEMFVGGGREMGVLVTRDGGALGLTLTVGCDLAVITAAVVCGMWLAATAPS